MQRPACPMRPEDERRINRRDKPQNHVRQVDPDGVFHPNLTALFWRRVGGDEDLAEGSE